jgi:Na+-driven multidrug efflux pump
MSIVKILNADMEARDRPGLVSVTAWVTLAATVILDLALIPDHGAQGAAAASTIAYVLAAGLTLAPYLRLNSVTLADLFVPRRDDLGMISRNLRLLPRRDA